eukprot:SAG31_NODE_13343_length_873_cov_5.615979_1_plen_142_part_10
MQKKAEDSKLEEIRKQIAEERQVMELEASANGKRKKEQAVSWMYEVPLSGDQASQEEHLLGKEVTLDATPGELDKLAEKPGALWMQDGSDAAQDMAIKIRMDPLLAIRKQEETAKRKVLQNPVEMLKRKLQLQQAQLAAEKR